MHSTLTRGASAGMTEGALAEMRSRLIAGLKRYFHGKRMEGLLSVQVQRGRPGVGAQGARGWEGGLAHAAVARGACAAKQSRVKV